MEVRKIETAPGLVFDASVAGDESSPLVLMLHGFGVSRYFWEAPVPAPGKAGYLPDAVPKVLADDCAWRHKRHAKEGVPNEAIDLHLSMLGKPPAMEAALAWYRARGERMPLGPIEVPTLYLWGDADDTVGRAAAEGTGEFIAASHRFEVLPGVGHYAADPVPARVNERLVDHLRRYAK